ncbi:hypothetical protein NHX12_012433 [Muraenolepis orangiensis]|uniref:Uncharacterized protein n=1 Tax=Muraenolepis orangiensis TaxID=630683 RepID=A0A9Q0I742_9TELE|nr:hypothetical protein NHX12_012433 [Muraenolepis orangiensis]
MPDQVRGCNKIQDHWDHRIYRVVRHPEEMGVVYSVVPVNQDGQGRQIHRTEMRQALVPENMPGNGPGHIVPLCGLLANAHSGVLHLYCLQAYGYRPSYLPSGPLGPTLLDGESSET